MEDTRTGIRVQFRIVGQYSYNATEEVDQILFSRDVLGLEVEKEFGKITGAFPQVALSSGVFCACVFCACVFCACRLFRRCFLFQSSVGPLVCVCARVSSSSDAQV